MGQTQSHANIEQQYDIVKLREDGSALLQHKNTQEEFLLRSVSSNIGEQLNCFQQILRKRQQIKSPHLLDLIQIRKKQEKNVCSVVHKMYLLIEYPFKTLRDEIMDKISQNKVTPFLEAELWSILYSCCMGLNTLYAKKMPHQCLSSSEIYINRQGLVKISDPILLGLEKNYIKVLKNAEEHVQISPEIINFLDDCNFSFYDKEKSDIFVLGAVMLEASLLRSIQLFDRQSKRPYLEIIPLALNEIRQKYSSSFCEILQKMLQLHSKFRPNFSEIINMIEKDNSLYESTDETTFQQLSQTAQSFSNMKNSKSQKTLPKAGWNGIVEKRGTAEQSIKYKTIQKPDIPVRMTPSQINKPKDDTIIKMLQTENFKSSMGKNYMPSPSPPPIYMPINQPQYIFYQQPPIFHQPIPYPNPHFSGDMHSSIPQAQFSPAPHQLPPVQNNQIGERFSYTKFGNIVLNKNPAKQKPLFSYDIPEINEILKSHLNPNAIKSTNVPNCYPSNPSRGTENELKPQSVKIQTFINQPIIRKNEQSIKKEANPEIFQSQQKNQIEPIVNTFPNEVYLNLNFVDEYKDSPPKIKQRNARNCARNKISLNAKKNEIFAVTQKSEESQETSPARIVESSSSLKLKQPQKSPGTQFNHERTPSSKKDIKSQSNSEQKQKYVVMILEGGGRYEGYLKNGLKNGEGKLEFNDGGYYVGEWRDNKMHGFGKLHYQNGQVAYEGNWEDDQFCGFGRVFNDRPQKLIGPFNYHDFADLNQQWIYYEGQFKNDSKHGKGKLRLTNGEVFEGNFVFDSIEGEGIFYTVNGQAIRGSWRDNILIQK